MQILWALFGELLVIIFSLVAGRIWQKRLDEPRMRTLCEELVRFVDGECDARTQKLMREHLASCSECQSQLKWKAALDARFSEVREVLTRGRS